MISKQKESISPFQKTNKSYKKTQTDKWQSITSKVAAAIRADRYRYPAASRHCPRRSSQQAAQLAATIRTDSESDVRG